jgi:pentatricopeptide repeat protein
MPAKPTVWTWNSLLSVFVWHRQSNSVKVIREMMHKHGVEYDMVTWNTIITGHVLQQKVVEAATAIRDMELQGYSMDSYTLRALRFLKDPEQLGVAIAELDRETHELAQWEMKAEEKERDELIDQGLRRLAMTERKARQ